MAKKLNTVNIIVVVNRIPSRPIGVKGLDMAFDRSLDGRITVTGEAMGRLSKKLVENRDKARSHYQLLSWEYMLSQLERVKVHADRRISGIRKTSGSMVTPQVWFSLEMAE